jgi:hypothetical protein
MRCLFDDVDVDDVDGDVDDVDGDDVCVRVCVCSCVCIFSVFTL